MIGFIPNALRSLLRRLGITKRPPPYIWGSAKYEERSSWKVYGEILIGVAIVSLSLYALWNFLYWHEGVLNEWDPYTIDGRYFAHHVRGGKTRSLTVEEYKVMSLYFARAVSGHLMAFHLTALAILYGDWKAAPTESVKTGA